MQVLSGLVSSTFQLTLNFLRTEGMHSLNHNVSQRLIAANRCAPGIAEVSNFLNLLSACLDRHFLREELERQAAEEQENNSTTPDPNQGKKKTLQRTDPNQGTT